MIKMICMIQNMRMNIDVCDVYINGGGEEVERMRRRWRERGEMEREVHWYTREEKIKRNYANNYRD